MPQKSVFCLASSRIQADHIVDRLNAANFSSNDISALFTDRLTSHKLAPEKHSKASEGAVAGAGAGGFIGGALGWIAGIGVLVIPGFGSLFAAGPILAALSCAAMGTVIGGISGALIGMGIPARETKLGEHALKDGNILISVHTQNAAETTQAEVIFAYSGARDIGTAEEAAVPADNRATEILTYTTASMQKGPAR